MKRIAFSNALRGLGQWLGLNWHVLAAVLIVAWLVACNWDLSPRVILGISVCAGLWLAAEISKWRSRLRGNSFWLAFLHKSTKGYFAPMRILVLGIFMIIGFAFLYMMLEGIEGYSGIRVVRTASGFRSVADWTKQFTRTYIYFSAVTFSSLDYGDPCPTPECGLIAIGEAIGGLIVVSTYIGLTVQKMTYLYRYKERKEYDQVDRQPGTGNLAEGS
jgi:hypothetical protein